MGHRQKVSEREQEELTPPLRPRRKLKIKRLPRGKSFERGNQIGISTRFVKGVSGCPGGRPASSKLSEAYRALLALPAGTRVEIRTNAEAMAYKVFKMGAGGNLGAAREVGDRSEGKPAVSIQVDGGGGDVALIAQYMRERSEIAGCPEGMENDEQLLLEEGEHENEAEA
jgi:hypothetical protein